MYGNLSHDNKIGTKHYFTLDIDVSNKAVFLETAFLANFQYTIGDTANINNVDFELTATPVVDQLFNMNEVVTCCIDMQHKKMLVINTHKASFDAFYVFNKFDEIDRTMGVNDYKVNMFSKIVSVPKGLDGEDVYTDLKIGGSMYINSQFSYEPEYGNGPNEISTQKYYHSTYQKWGMFVCTIDDIEYKIPFTVTHRNESSVFEKCFKLKSGSHTIKLDIYYSNYSSLTSNGLTAYFMGSNVVVMQSSPLSIVGYAKTQDSPIYGWVIGTTALDIDEIKIPDVIPGTTIPVVGILYGTYDGSWSNLANESENVRRIKFWNPEWGTGAPNDAKLEMQNLYNKSSSYGYAFSSSGYLPNLMKIVFGKNTQYCLADSNGYQYSSSTNNLSEGLPILDFSKCRSIKVLGGHDTYYSYYGCRQSADILANLTQEDSGLYTEEINVSMDPICALITTWKVLTNHYNGSVACCFRDYSRIVEDTFVESWLDLNINGKSHKLGICLNQSSPYYSSYNYCGYRSIRNLHCDAENVYFMPYWSEDVLPNSYKFLNPDVRFDIDWCNLRQTSFESYSYIYGFLAPNLFPKDVSYYSTNSEYFQFNLTNAAEDSPVHIKYEFDGNVLVAGYGCSGYFYLYGVSRYGNYNSTSCYTNEHIYVNHDFAIKIHGSFFAVSRSKNNASYYTNIDSLMPCIYPYSSSLSPSSYVTRPYYSSSITTTKTTGDYWQRNNTTDPVLYAWNDTYTSWSIYDQIYQLNDADHKRNIPMKIEIDGNFFFPCVYFYVSTTYREGSPWDPYWNDYTNKPENVVLARVKGDYVGHPDLFSVCSRSTYRSRITSSVSRSSWTIDYTPYSENIIINATHGENVNHDPIHPYEVHVDRNAIFTSGSPSYNYGNYNTIFFCDKIAGAYKCQGPSYSSGADIAVTNFLRYPEYFHATKRGEINFNGFVDGAVLGTLSLTSRVLPKELTIDFSNVAYIGEGLMIGCVCSGNFVWPTAEHPAKWMSTQPVAGETLRWEYLDAVYDAYQQALSNNETTFSVDSGLYRDYMVIPSIDFNAEIVGSIYGDIMFRKLNGITPTDDIAVDTWVEHVFYDITHTLIDADDAYFTDIYSINGHFTNYSKSGYYFNEQYDYKRTYYGSLTPEQFHNEFKTKISTYISYDYHGCTSNVLANKYYQKTVGDIEFPTYTIGSCIKHLTSFAFLGLPVRCKTGDDANFPFKEINLPNVKAIGEWAFTFGVWRGDDSEVVEVGAVNYNVATNLVKTVRVGLDTYWIDYNPNVNEFIVPEHNTHFVIENGYIYSADKKILFRAVNNETIRSYTAADGPVAIPSTVEMIIDGSALAYDQRITTMDFTDASRLETGMKLMPPNLTSIALPSDTSLAIDSLPENCNFRIIDVGGSNSIYYQPAGGLASEVYSPTAANAYPTTEVYKVYSDFASDYSVHTDMALPNVISPSTVNHDYVTLGDYGRAGNTYYKDQHFYEQNDVFSESEYSDVQNALGSGAGSFYYGSIYAKRQQTPFTSNYNVIYFRPNTDGTPTRLNLENRCMIYNCKRTLDILGVNSDMTHPLWINGVIKKFAITSGSGTQTTTVSADGKSLYYLNCLMHVATADPIDEYHITTHVWPGAFYGCTIDKLYIDITAPDISVDNPLGSTGGSFIQRTPIPNEWYGLFRGAKINKLYFNYSDLPAITMPAYSTSLNERTVMATPIWPTVLSTYDEAHINEIHIIGLTQEILDNDTLTLNPSAYGEGITWSLLAGLCPMCGEYENGKYVYHNPEVFLDTEPNLNFIKMNRNMGYGVKWHNAAELFKNVKYACPGAAPCEPLNCHVIEGSKINDTTYDLYYFWNGAFVFIDGDNQDVSIKYTRIGRSALFITGNPTSLVLDKIGTGRWRNEDTWQPMFYSNRAPYGWENAASITTDQLYTQMRVNTIEKFDKLTFDLSDVEDGALEICRGSFSEGTESPDPEDPSTPHDLSYKSYGYNDTVLRIVEYTGDGCHAADLFERLNELRICYRQGVDKDPANDYISSSSIITRTAAETLTFLHDTKIRAYVGGRMNFWLNYGNNNADLTITPFYNTITNMNGMYYSWTEARSPIDMPQIQRCLIPLKNTDHCTWDITTKIPTINVPAGTTPDEFVNIWTEARIESFRYDSVTFNSDYWVDWQIFDMSAVYDCEDALDGLSWVYEHYLAEQTAQGKHVFFKKIVLSKLPTHYDPADSSIDSTGGNDLNYNVYTRNVVRYDGTVGGEVYCPIQIISLCMNVTRNWAIPLAFSYPFPWTEYVCDAETSAITIATLTNDISTSKISNGMFYITMTDDMWDDLEHIHAYFTHPDYAPLSSDTILVKDLTITSNCTKMILGSISSLILREFELEDLDKVYIEEYAWLGGFVGERLSVHNITPLWLSVRSQKKRYSDDDTINQSKYFENWFSYTPNLKNIELMFDDDDVDAFLAERDSVEHPVVSVWRGLFEFLMQKIDVIKTNLRFDRTTQLFAYSEVLPDTIIVPSASSLANIGANTFDQTQDAFSINWVDFDGRPISLADALVSTHGYAFAHMHYDAAHAVMEFPNLTKVNRDFDYAEGLKEITAPSCTSFTMIDAGTVELIKVPTGCVVNVPSSVLVIFL